MRRAPPLLLLSLLAFPGTVATGPPSPATPPAVPTPAPAGQLQRGETTYVLACAICHGDRLEGVSAPELDGAAFRALYRTLPPRALHDLIRDTMPDDRRGTLSPQEVLDVTAYLLHENGLPRPQGELNAETLDHVTPTP